MYSELLSLSKPNVLPVLVQKNHLSGLQQSLLKVIFWNSQQLMEVRREMQPIIRRNKSRSNVNDAYKAFGPQRNNNTVKLQVTNSVLHSILAALSFLFCHWLMLPQFIIKLTEALLCVKCSCKLGMHCSSIQVLHE